MLATSEDWSKPVQTVRRNGYQRSFDSRTSGRLFCCPNGAAFGVTMQRNSCDTFSRDTLSTCYGGVFLKLFVRVRLPTKCTTQGASQPTPNQVPLYVEDARCYLALGSQLFLTDV